MPSPGHKTRFLLDEFDFSTDTFTLGMSIDIPQEDATTFQATAAASVAMTPAGSLDMSGYYSGGQAGKLEAEIKARLGVGAVVAGLFGTDIVACPCYILPGTQGEMMKISAGTKLLQMSGKWSSGVGGILRGLRAYQGTLTAVGAQAGIDFGSAGSSGGTAYLFVQAIGGTATNAQIKVQSDSVAGFTGAADEGTWTISAKGAYVLALTGVIGRYVRVNVVSMGGATSLNVAVVVCVNGVTMN
jgi:hypothetical protein